MTIPPIDSYLGLYKLAEGRQQYQPSSRWCLGEYKPDEALSKKHEFILDEFLHPPSASAHQTFLRNSHF